MALRLNNTMNTIADNEIFAEYHFSSGVYTTERKDLLNKTLQVFDESIKEVLTHYTLDDIYPVIQTGSMIQDSRMEEFNYYICQKAWEILDSQGIDMSGLSTVLTECWGQEHHKTSGMELHAHNTGTHISGFYFLEVPENSSRIIFHDPRPTKVFTSLPEKNSNDITLSTSYLNFLPKPGMFFFTNSWLPHSFPRNASELPFRFIHFNISVVQNYQQPTQTAVNDVEIV